MAAKSKARLAFQFVCVALIWLGMLSCLMLLCGGVYETEEKECGSRPENNEGKLLERAEVNHSENALFYKVHVLRERL